MRKIFLFLGLLGILLSSLASFTINKQLVNNRVRNCENAVLKYTELSSKMFAILDEMSTDQIAFTKKNPITLSSLQEFLHKSLTTSAASLYDKNGALIGSYKWHNDGSVTETKAPLMNAQSFIADKAYGWVNCIFEKSRTDVTFLFLSPVYDSFSKDPISFVACEYHIYPIIQLIKELFISPFTYAYIVDKNHKTVLNPYYQPGFTVTPTPLPPAFLFGLPDTISNPIPNSDGWHIIMQFDRANMLGVTKEVLHTPILLLFSWGGSILFLLAYFWRVDKGSRLSLWGLSIGFSALICTAIGYFFYCFSVFINPLESTITFFEILDDVNRTKSDKPIQIPTSFMISSISFPDSTSFSIDGYMTQIYPIDSPVQRGFTFPKEGGGDNSEIVEISRIVSGNEEKITYQFNLLMRQAFSEKIFPFDVRNLKLNVWPIDEDHDIIFIPDINMYNSLFPSNMPSLSRHIALVGWEVTDSFYIYTNPSSYFRWTSDYIIDTKSLTFCIRAKRNLVDVYISTFFPLFICEILTFILIIIPLRKLESPTLDSFANLLAIVFVVIISQIDFHKTLGADSFAYIEYIYFFFYAQIALLSANLVVLTTSKSHFRIVHYRENLIPQLAYWPLFLTTFLAILYTSFF